MARRVFVHVGTPKSGTTYLQSILYASRDSLRDHGFLLPGDDRTDQVWATMVVREDPRLDERPDRARQAWDRLVRDTAAWDGDALVTHEYFGAATADQARTAVESLSPSEVHVVVTAREPLGTLCAAWQQSLKYRHTEPLDTFSTEAGDDPTVLWNWRSLDIAEVLRRWAPTVPPERVHVVSTPRDKAEPTTLWDRFCAVLGLDPAACDTDLAERNPTMGLVEAEALRRLNHHLGALDNAFARTTWIRRYLAEHHLVSGSGERFWPSPARIEECRTRAEAAVALVRERGYHVQGDLADLLVPEDLPHRRTPAEVTDREVADVLTRLAGTVLDDVRSRRRELDELRR